MQEQRRPVLRPGGRRQLVGDAVRAAAGAVVVAAADHRERTKRVGVVDSHPAGLGGACVLVREISIREMELLWQRKSVSDGAA